MFLADPMRLRAWLEHKGMSYRELGGYVGVSKQFIGQLATGQKESCSAEVAAKIEQVLFLAPCKRGPGMEPLFFTRRSDKIAEHSVVDGEAS